MVVWRVSGQVLFGGELMERRPIRSRIVKRGSIPRVPYEEPLVPGLRKKQEQTNAIGFTAKIGGEDEED